MRCGERLDMKVEKGGTVCLAAFMLWASPVVLAIVCFLFAMTLLMLARHPLVLLLPLLLFLLRLLCSLPPCVPCV